MDDPLPKIFFVQQLHFLLGAGAYLVPCQISVLEFFMKIVNS